MINIFRYESTLKSCRKKFNKIKFVSYGFLNQALSPTVSQFGPKTPDLAICYDLELAFDLMVRPSASDICDASREIGMK